MNRVDCMQRDLVQYIISKPYSHSFQQSLLCHAVPHDWKLANIAPQFKKGPKNQGSSHRLDKISHIF